MHEGRAQVQIVMMRVIGVRAIGRSGTLRQRVVVIVPMIVSMVATVLCP